MAFPVGPVVRVLNAHRGYRCRHSGVCCTAGWDIAIGAGELARVETAINAGELMPPGGWPCVETGPDLPAGAAAILCRTPAGDCVFFDRDGGRLCAIQRAAGHEALPVACRHFPRVVLADDEAVSVAISHVCPTAAAMLIHGDEDLAIVEERGALGSEPVAEGFDARGTVPPFVRPGVVFDRASWRLWEAFVVEACNRAGTPERALAMMARAADELRAWTPAKGEMAMLASDVVARARETHGRDCRAWWPWERVVAFRAIATECIRPGWPRPVELPAVPGPAGARAWDAGARTGRRYLGARAFAAWSAYLGAGVRTQVAVLAVTLAVLRGEVERAAVGAAGNGRDLWLAALSAADRLIVHEVDDAALCRHVAIVEKMSPSAFAEWVGVEAA